MIGNQILANYKEFSWKNKHLLISSIHNLIITQYTGIYSVNHIDHCHMMRVRQSTWTQLWVILIFKVTEAVKVHISFRSAWMISHAYWIQQVQQTRLSCGKIHVFTIIQCHTYSNPANWCSLSFWLCKVQCSNHGGSQNVRSVMHPFFAEPWTIVNSNAGSQ